MFRRGKKTGAEQSPEAPRSKTLPRKVPEKDNKGPFGRKGTTPHGTFSGGSAAKAFQRTLSDPVFLGQDPMQPAAASRKPGKGASTKEKKRRGSATSNGSAGGNAKKQGKPTPVSPNPNSAGFDGKAKPNGKPSPTAAAAARAGGAGGGGGGMQRKTSVYGRRGSVGKVAEFLGSEDISRAKWYLGRSHRLECDMAVLAADMGDFLVRMSSTGDKYVVVVNDHGKPQNFQCFIGPGKKVKLGGREFNGIMECLEHLRTNPVRSQHADGKMYYLNKPASDKIWYVGMMARDECEKMVLAAGKNDFVIRLASDMKNFVLVINQGDGSCKHCKIIHDVNTFTLAKKVARTMEELIEELRNVAIASNDGKSKLYLRKPAAKADYYAGQMARTECEAFVKKSQEGNYLIRQNSKGDKYVLVVNAGQQLVMNFIINYDNDTKKFVFGGQPHDSLELILRYLRKTPLQGKDGKNLYINVAARMTDADDMIADAHFGFGGFGEEEAAPPSSSGGGGRSMFASSGGLPFFGDDEDEDMDMEFNSSDMFYDSVDEPGGNSFEPFRVTAIKDIPNVCKKGDAMFVLSESGSTYGAVFQGSQVDVPKSSVAKETPRAAGADDGDDDEEENDEDGDAGNGFGGFDGDDDDDDDDEDDDDDDEDEEDEDEENPIEDIEAERAKMQALMETMGP